VFDLIFSTLAAGSDATDTVMIPSRGWHANHRRAADAAHLKVHRTAASPLKKGTFPILRENDSPDRFLILELSGEPRAA